MVGGVECGVDIESDFSGLGQAGKFLVLSPLTPSAIFDALLCIMRELVSVILQTAFLYHLRWREMHDHDQS